MTRSVSPQSRPVTDDSAVDRRLGARDREYVATLDPEERSVVVDTILRYQRSDGLGVGDAVPALELVRLDDSEPARLEILADDRPLVLVFGSFT
jgi:hypothetical protein